MRTTQAGPSRRVVPVSPHDTNDLASYARCLYLGGAGCHGGPGITFIPGYNAAHQVIDDRVS